MAQTLQAVYVMYDIQSLKTARVNNLEESQRLSMCFFDLKRTRL